MMKSGRRGENTLPPGETPRGSALCRVRRPSTRQAEGTQPQGGGIGTRPLAGRSRAFSKEAGEAGLGSRIRTGIVTEG